MINNYPFHNSGWVPPEYEAIVQVLLDKIVKSRFLVPHPFSPSFGTQKYRKLTKRKLVFFVGESNFDKAAAQIFRFINSY